MPMYTELSCRRLGLPISQLKALTLARQCGFQAVEPEVRYVMALDDGLAAQVGAYLGQQRLRWGAATLPIDFRNDEASFTRGMVKLPAVARALQRAGCDRVVSYLPWGSDRYPYREQVKRMTKRLREIAVILDAFGVRLGVEYAGARAAYATSRYPFVHRLCQAREVLDVVGYRAVGLVLDSWQWHAAGETECDLLDLDPESIVAVDLADAPQGVPRHELRPGRAELPTSTGVVDIEGFVASLRQIGYDGPVRAEAYDPYLASLGPTRAIARVAHALCRALAPSRRTPADAALDTGALTLPFGRAL